MLVWRKQVYASDLKSDGLKTMLVQIQLPAPKKENANKIITYSFFRIRGNKMSKKEFETLEEWQNYGYQLFGDNVLEWKFICPVCKTVITVGGLFKLNPVIIKDVEGGSFDFAYDK